MPILEKYGGAKLGRWMENMVILLGAYVQIDTLSGEIWLRGRFSSWLNEFWAIAPKNEHV